MKQEKLQLSEGQHFDGDYRQQIGNLTTALFGTPDAPRFPLLLGEDDPAKEILDIKNLALAAGPVVKKGNAGVQGLYREHCSHCHGITGDGAGPTASSLNPYPRDFRLGKFKFKSTPLRSPPTDGDLNRVLLEGIPGTAMPSFRALPEADRAALVDYVKYLSIRGEYERRLIGEIGALDGEPLVQIPDEMDLRSEEAPIPETVEDQLFAYVGEFLLDEILARWLDRGDAVTEVSEDLVPFDFSSEDFGQLVRLGRELYAGKANCVQCHGATGLGDGLTGNFDDWTSDWIKSPGVDLTAPETYTDFLNAGALPPRPILPRNLHYAVYRGGGTPEDLFRRIKNGIEGTPMPSSPSLSDEEVWAVVAYIKALPFSQPAP